jgi:hypothetical protein
MKIFFTCSYSGKKLYQKNFDAVIKAIEKNDVELITTERPAYIEIGNKDRTKKIQNHNKLHYESIRRAIIESDAVIIDNSHESFRLGHEATLALSFNKPVLVLSVNRDMSMFIKHKNFSGAKYTPYNLQSIIDNFVKTAHKKLLSIRFNMFISEEQQNYLQKVANFENSTMSEYLRKLIEEDIGK